jgi:hypothetical protein
VNARETLDGFKAQLAAVTPGPYILSRFDHGGGRMYVESGSSRKLVADTFKEGDREFHYTAPSTVARLTGALEAVLGLCDDSDVPDRVNSCIGVARIRAAIEDALKEGQS